METSNDCSASKAHLTILVEPGKQRYWTDDHAYARRWCEDMMRAVKEMKARKRSEWRHPSKQMLTDTHAVTRHSNDLPKMFDSMAGKVR